MVDILLLIAIHISQLSLDLRIEYLSENIPIKYLRYFFVISFLVILNFRLYVFRFFPYSNFSLMFLLVFFDVFVDIIKIKLLQLSFLYFIYQTNLLINEFFYSNILLLGSKFFYFVFYLIQQVLVVLYHFLGIFTTTALFISFIYYFSSIFDSFLKAGGFIFYFFQPFVAVKNHQTQNDLTDIHANLTIGNGHDCPFDNTSTCFSATSSKKRVSFLNEPLIRYFDKNFSSSHSNTSDETSEKVESEGSKGNNRKKFYIIETFDKLGEAFDRMNFPIEGHNFYYKYILVLSF
jgi:hypothetical protein